jgi:hypothetical protein
LLLHWIPLDRPAGANHDVGHVTDRLSADGEFQRTDGGLPAPDAVEKIPLVMCAFIERLIVRAEPPSPGDPR